MRPTLGDEGQDPRSGVAPLRRLRKMAGDQGIDAEAPPGSVDGEHELDDDEEEISPRPFAPGVIEAEPEIDRHRGTEDAAEADGGSCDQGNGDNHFRGIDDRPPDPSGLSV